MISILTILILLIINKKENMGDVFEGSRRNSYQRLIFYNGSDFPKE